MNKEDLLRLKKKLTHLSNQEQKQRDLHLRKLANGEIQGPMTGYASIDKPWFKYYANSKLNVNLPKKTAYKFIYEANQNNLDKVALNYLDKDIKYREVFEHIDEVAKALLYQNVKHGDIVTICMPNMPETIYLFYALNKIGAIADFLDPRATQNVMEHHLQLAKSKLLITIDECYSMFENLKENTEIETIVNINIINSLSNMSKPINDSLSWTDFINKGSSVSHINEVNYYKEKLATILHTGGTTGIPKGALLTDDNLNALAVQWNNSGIKYDDYSTLLSLMPPFVSFGLVANLHMPLYNHMKLVLIPEYAPEKIVDQIKKYKPNYIPASPAHWEYIYNYLKHDNIDFSSLKMGLMGGDILNAKIRNRLNEKFVNGNMKIAYGLTESSTALTLPYNEEMALKENVGIPLSNTILGIFDTETLEEKEYNQIGEICAITPNTMVEYYGMPDETKKVLKKHSDGNVWLHTGDMGYINEDGILTVKGRIKKMIIRYDGIKVYAIDIENALSNCPIVDQCAVVGVKDDNHIQGALPVAYIVLNSDVVLNKDVEDYLYQYCEQNIIDYANPKDLVFVKSLPYTKNGKINFKLLKEMYEDNKQKLNKEKKLMMN